VTAAVTDASVDGGGLLDAAPGQMARDALVVTACTLLSRLTGFVRVLVAAAVLSNGPLGDTYHAANMIPNLLFELVAGGVLQAVLVPTFVAARRTDGDVGLGDAAGAVAGVLTAALSVVAAVVILVSPLLAWALTALEDDAALVADKRNLITPMLIVFVPQIVFYGIGMVTTAALAARGRFAAAALAPAVNNLVVIACYLAFSASRDGRAASLDLDAAEFAWLVGGTTLAVVAFTAVPGIVLGMQGVRWWPTWQPGHPAVRSLRSSVRWAMLSVVGTLVPMGAAIVLGSGARGGVAVFTIAFTFFVLPHALIAVPVATALAPRVADAWQRRRTHDTADLVERSVQVVVPMLLLGAAGMVSLSWPIARVVGSIGQAGSQGTAPIAHAIAVFGVSLVGYGVAFVMTRVLFGLGDVRRAAQLVSASAVAGVVVMTIAAAVMVDGERAAALALGYGAAQMVSAVLLGARVRRLLGVPTWSGLGRLSVGSLVAAVVASATMFAVQQALPVDRAGSMVAIVVAGPLGIAAFLAAARPLAGLSPSMLVLRGVVSRGQQPVTRMHPDRGSTPGTPDER